MNSLKKTQDFSSVRRCLCLDFNRRNLSVSDKAQSAETASLVCVFMEFKDYVQFHEFFVKMKDLCSYARKF